MAKRRIVALHSDTHGGHSLGLLSPETQLWGEDEHGEPVPYRPALNATQEYLWEAYLEDIAQVVEIAGTSQIVVIHAGDATQGNKYMQRWVSPIQSDQIHIAKANFQPWLDLPNVKTIRLMMGTQSHEFGQGSAPTLLATELRQGRRKRNVKALRHGLFDVDGVSFDIAHHGPHPGSRNWLEGNVARYYLRDLMMREFSRGNEPPRIVVRADRHVYIPEVVLKQRDRGQEYTSSLLLIPSYCGLSYYASQKVQSPHLLTNGMVVVVVEDGRPVDVVSLVRTTDLRRKEIL